MPGGRLHAQKNRETRSPGGGGGSSVASLWMNQPLYAAPLPGSLGAHGGDASYSGHRPGTANNQARAPAASSCRACVDALGES